jgi:hypothetical protein
MGEGRGGEEIFWKLRANISIALRRLKNGARGGIGGEWVERFLQSAGRCDKISDGLGYRNSPYISQIRLI